MLDEDFCERLEYAFSGSLAKSNNMDWKRCWCDGVLLPGNERVYLSGQLLTTREVVIKAWIDEGRRRGDQPSQFLYDMRLAFGENSTNKIKDGHRIDNCIPDREAESWITLDRENKKIEVQLM